MPSRRTVLASLGAVLSASLPGCARNGSTELDPPFEEQAQLGEAAAVSFAVEPSHEYTYLPEAEAVEYETLGPSHVTRQEQLPFAEWGTRRATHHAYERLRSLVASEFPDDDLITIVMGSLPKWALTDDAPGTPATELAFKRAVDLGLTVEYNHLYDADGELRLTPEMPWETLTAAVPRAMAVTMLFPERTYTAILPVQCRRDLEIASDAEIETLS